MEEASFLSSELVKLEVSKQKNDRRRSFGRGASSQSSIRPKPRPRPRPRPRPDTLADGKVVFRLLCHISTAGGVIGSSGSIIKHLESLTGTRIWFEEVLPSCDERVINIGGAAAFEKNIPAEGGERDEMVDVSKAQEALMRVFERVLEVEGSGRNKENSGISEQHGNGFTSCRLLARNGQIGALMGKGGKNVDEIRKSSGAKISVLTKEQIPVCASSEEELIQIMGRVVHVKKAMLAVSRCLQDQAFVGGAPGRMAYPSVPQNVQNDFVPNSSSQSSSSSGITMEHHLARQFSSIDAERTPNLEVDSSAREVIFRLLCSNLVAGGVIGKNANVVKFLEKETGASISFSSPVSGSKERVAVISSLENPDAFNSPAQSAIIQVFARCIEVGLDRGMISNFGNGERVSTRILVALNQIGFLLDESGRIASDISLESGTDIKLLDEYALPNCAGVDDKAIQITGDYKNVKSALFQITRRLRENIFSGVVPRSADCGHSSGRIVPGSIPSSGEVDIQPQSDLPKESGLSHVNQRDHLGFIHKSRSGQLPGLRRKPVKTKGRRTVPVNDAQGLTNSSGGLKHESASETGGTQQTVEVVVPGEVFSLVYGENGSNLARLKEISGANVTIQDPCPGQQNGKVIISATADRIQIAQSLLQAFIFL